MAPPVRYPVEDFTQAERDRLAPHVTSLDEPVFALRNLPETVKGALFARYSRYPGTLRRLFLDEFADSLPQGAAGWEETEGERAAKLYETIFLGYGDDSVAQLGGVHVACEWTSNVLTKILQRPRIGAYLEQSTRYIAYDRPMEGTGGYRYYRDDALGPDYAGGDGRALRDLLGLAAAGDRLGRRSAFPAAPGDSPAAHARAIKAKALDLLRGLLPAASLSHMGIYASGQTYEQLILHLLAHPLPEAQRYGRMILAAVKAVIPSFVTRVERPDRGGRWVSVPPGRASARASGGRSGSAWPRARTPTAPRCACCASTATRSTCSPRCSSRRRGLRGGGAGRRGRPRARHEADDARELLGDRENRRHRPGRGYEALRYRFEIVSDYGAFRDLQRHRMLTVQWQALTPELGAGVPEEVDAAGVGDEYRRALEVSRAAWQALVGRRARPARRPVRALPGLPDAVHPRPQRPRGDAADRAALGPRGPSLLPRRRARDARPHRRGPPVGRPPR